MSLPRVLVVTLLSLLIVHIPLAQQRQDHQSAWNTLIQKNPAVVDDPQVSWKDRLILFALSPEQAQAYYRGTDPETILLENGQTLQQYLDQRLAPIGSLYYPLPAVCPLFSLEGGTSGEPLALMARGENLTHQGGSASGCSIPDDATALMIQLRMESPVNAPVEVKLWPVDSPEPAESVIEATVGQSDSTMAVVRLSRLDTPDRADFQFYSSDWIVLDGQAVGYFRPMTAADSPSSDFDFYTEWGGNGNSFFGTLPLANTGSNNSFFGNIAGNFNTTGSGNSFFGRAAGTKNTTGYSNSFFGHTAGASNTTGTQNSFFGEDAGASNTTGSYNSFFGEGAGEFNTTGHSNTFVGQEAGYSNTTGNKNSFFGKNAGESNDTGYQNSFFGHRAGRFNTTGNENSFFGEEAGEDNTTGYDNSFFGEAAGRNNTTGRSNAFFGEDAGLKNTTGDFNSFFGDDAGWSNSTAIRNSFFGQAAGWSNTTGHSNSFFGQVAGWFNITGHSNSFFGQSTGLRATGNNNTFVGREAGFGAKSGFDNTASGNSLFGYRSGYFITSGSRNAFFGYESGYSNTAGHSNAFFGDSAGHQNTTGTVNSFFGTNSGYSNTVGNQNTFFGADSGIVNTTGYSNSLFGYRTGTSNTKGAANTFIGSEVGLSNTVENFNTLIGSLANLDPGPKPAKSPVVNATAVGYRSYVSRSNSLVLGSIAGVNFASNNVNVGIGTTAPSAPLHISRADGTSRILVEEESETTQVRTMLELKNNGGARITLKNGPLNTAWIFSTNSKDQFYFSRAGTPGAEFLLFPNGRLKIGPGASTVFDLDPTGNLMIKGNLTANGINYPSDRNRKENFIEVDPQQTLEKLASVPVTEWNFKQDNTRHIGPMAQDFYSAFGVGKDDKHLDPTDTAGVTMAAIQGLYQQNKELRAELEALKQELAELKQR